MRSDPGFKHFLSSRSRWKQAPVLPDAQAWSILRLAGSAAEAAGAADDGLATGGGASIREAVAAPARHFLDAMQAEGVLGCPKHFPSYNPVLKCSEFHWIKLFFMTFFNGKTILIYFS